MAIAAALNLLVTSPSEQLKNDLKKNGLTVQQFSRTLTSQFDSATRKAKNDIKSMGAAIDVALQHGIVSAKEHGDAMTVLGGAYQYVYHSGKTYSAMLKDASEIMDRHQVETDQTITRLKEMDGMLKAGKITAHAYTQELKAMTVAQAAVKPTANFGSQVSAIAARQVKPEAAFAQGRRALDRAWITGAIDDTKQYNAELGRLRKNLEDASGVTAVNAEADKRRKLDAANAAEDAAKVEAARNQMIAEATTLTERHFSAEQRLFATRSNLNRLLAHQTISQATYNKELAVANRLYREQATLSGKLGLTARSFKSATSFVNPWFAVALGAGAAVKEGMEFEKSMDRVSSLASTTRAEIERLTVQASTLGRTTVFSSKDAASGMAELARSGFKTNEIMQSIPATMRLAAIGEIEVAEASQVAAQIMAGMQIPARNLGDVVDSIAVASTNSVSSVTDLGEALKFVGPAAKQAGVSLDEVMASIMVLSNSGMNGELGGTAMRNILFRMADRTDEAEAELKRLGVTFTGLGGEILPVVDIIRQFEEALEGASSGDRLKSFGQIFQNRSATAMAALVGAGSEEFGKMLQLQKDREGLAERLETQLNDNLMGDLELLGSTVSDIATSIYNSGLDKVLRGFVNGLTFVVKSVQIFGQGLIMSVRMLQAGLGGIVWGLLELIPDVVEPRWAKDTKLVAKEFAIAGAAEMKRTSDGIWEMVREGDRIGERALHGEAVPDVQKMIDRNESDQSALQERAVAMAQEAQAAQDANERAQAFVKSLRQQSGALSDVKNNAAEFAAIMKSAASDADKMEAHFENWVAPIRKAAAEQAKILADARRAAEAVGKTTGGKLLMENDNFIARIIAAGVDHWENRRQIAETTLDIEKEIAELQWRRDFAAANGREATSREIAAWKNAKGATGEERKRLDLIISQAEALERAAKARETEREKLKSDAETMRQNAAELKKQFDPMLGFREEFIKLSVMKGSGLIGGKTFDKALKELENTTLGKGGPRNIGYAGAVEAGSAEAFSAGLARLKNPEVEELKRLLDEMRNNGRTLREINKGIKNQEKAELLDMNSM